LLKRRTTTVFKARLVSAIEAGEGRMTAHARKPDMRPDVRSDVRPNVRTGAGVLAKPMIALGIALAATSLAIALFCASGRADEAETVPFARGGVGSKAEYCEDCHGAAGQGYVGYLVMPRLAGQTTVYLEAQLRNFAEGRRGRELFINMARVHGVSPEARSALALHFRDANPRPFGGAPHHLVATGKRTYEEGAPAANIPACSACHGPDAKGQGVNPRLAGQIYPYIVARLSKWRGRYSAETSNVGASAQMVRISHQMTQSQIAALAAYLSQLH
jgi:cytochrome c553